MSLSSTNNPVDAKWDKSYLKDVWNSLFNVDIFKPVQEDNVQIQAIFMLLETAILNVKRIGAELRSIETEKIAFLEQVAVLKKENETLKEKSERRCQQCTKLEQKLADKQKETKDVQQRIQSIAIILGLGADACPSVARSGNPPNAIMETQTALNELMSEMFMNNRCESSGVKRHQIVDIDRILVADTAPLEKDPGKGGRKLHGEGNIVVPETQDPGFPRVCPPVAQSPRKETPKKEEKRKMVDLEEDKSPVLMERRSLKKRRKDFNSSWRDESNLSAGITEPQEDENSPPLLLSTIQPLCGQSSSVTKRSPKKTSAESKKPQSPPVLQLPQPKAGVVSGAVPKDNTAMSGRTTKDSTSYAWKLNPDTSFACSDATANRLKQTTLDVRPVSKKKRDVTTLKGFKGGILCSRGNKIEEDDSCGAENKGKRKDIDNSVVKAASRSEPNANLVVIEDDDIIDTSPDKKELTKSVSRSKCAIVPPVVKKKLQLRSDGPPIMAVDMDETFFAPMAASTCNFPASDKETETWEKPANEVVEAVKVAESLAPKKDNQKERPLKGKPGDNSPDYKYKRDAVRKKSERMKLEGWDCHECARYYANIGEVMNQSEVKRRMNKCSRHRAKFPVLHLTPPGFWDPKFASSDESD